jgi:hypothetical protein
VAAATGTARGGASSTSFAAEDLGGLDAQTLRELGVAEWEIDGLVGGGAGDPEGVHLDKRSSGSGSGSGSGRIRVGVHIVVLFSYMYEVSS